MRFRNVHQLVLHQVVNIKNEACIPAGLALTQTLINNIRKLTKTNLMYKSNYKCRLFTKCESATAPGPRRWHH